jgi:L-asparaginase II
MTANPYQPLVEITRGPLVESIHFGAFAVVDSDGHLLASAGDPQYKTYLRSSSKPLQALPLLELGGAKTFNLSDAEIAIMCASHSGTDLHFKTVSALQARLGLAESDLLCGIEPVGDESTRDELIRRGETPTPNRHDCSGKHTGFLALAKLCGYSKEDYINPSHALQQLVIKTFAQMVDYPLEQIDVGIDGCSVPVFGVPLYNAALGLARLCDPSQLKPERAAACRQVTQAMTAQPIMVAGPGKFDTLAMQLGRGKFISKGGAEGYQVLGIMPGAISPGSPALGVAIKISDGDRIGRAKPIVATEILRKLGIFSGEQIRNGLSQLAARPVTNWRNLEVGVMRPAFPFDLSI